MSTTFYENDLFNDYRFSADFFGTLSSGFTYNGNIGAYGAGINTGDRDWFSFSAGSTGKVTLNIDAAQAKVTYSADGKYYYCYSTQPLTVNVSKGATYYFEVASRTAAYGFTYRVTGSFSGGVSASPADLAFYKTSTVHQAAGPKYTVLTSTAKSYLDVSIQNKGKGAAAGTDVYVYIDDRYHMEFSLAALESGRYVVKTNLDLGILSAGKHKIAVTIDPAGAVKESNIKNNTLHKNITVKDTTPPGKVALATSYQEKYNAVLTWSAATDNVKVAKYQVVYYQTYGSYKTVTASKTSFTIKNLKPGTYYYTVTAIDSSKNHGAASDARQITILDVTAPSTVSVRAKTSGNAVYLTWKTPKDNVGVTGYVLQYGVDLEQTIHLSADQLSHQFTNLAQGTFQYRIFAVDAAGNRSKAAIKKTTVKTSLPAYSAMNAEVIQSGGVQTLADIQYVYLDFDGESTSYKGEYCAVESVTMTNSRLSASDIALIAAQLNTQYARRGVLFVTERPVGIEYSTVFIGYTGDLGDYRGLAETIDKGNQIGSDNAFVILSGAETLEGIIATIAHETEHIVFGLEHEGDGLDAYAATGNLIVGAGVTSTGLVLTVFSPLALMDGFTIGLGGDVMAMTLLKGQTGRNNTVVSKGVFDVHGVAIDTIVSEGPSSVISSGGAFMDVHHGGVASGTTVYSGGSLYIQSGGVAYDTLLRPYGRCVVMNGGAAYRGLVESNANFLVLSGSFAEAITVASRGALLVYGVVNSTMVASNGYLQLLRHGDQEGGGTAHNTIIADGGTMRIESECLARNTTMENSYMYISSGGMHTGELDIGAGAVVSAYAGGIVDFALEGRKTVDTYLIKNIGSIVGTPTYTITVSADQARGTYKLASGAASFKQSITVGDESFDYGTLTVNGAVLNNGNTSYRLTQKNGELLLTVGNYAPSNPDLLFTTPAGWSSSMVVSNVKKTNTDSAICVGDAVYLDWAVRNDGTVASGAFKVSLYLGNELLNTFSVKSLGVGASYTYTDYAVSASKFGAAGEYQFKLVIDEAGTVKDGDRSNNVAIKNIAVSANNSSASSEFKIKGSSTLTAFVAGYDNISWNNFSYIYTATGFSSLTKAYFYTALNIIDAEKGTKAGDANLCWAATASNMLVYGGWTIGGMNNENAVFDYFRKYFLNNNGGYTACGLTWFFNGNYNGARIGGGGLFQSVSANNYITEFAICGAYGAYGYQTVSDLSGFKMVEEALRDGKTVGVGIGWYKSYVSDYSITGRNGGHAITVVGIIYDTRYAKTDPRYYAGLIVSDSDDDKNLGDPSKAPNRMHVISVEWHAATASYYTTGSDYSFGRIESFQVLTPKSAAVAGGASASAVSNLSFASYVGNDNIPYIVVTDPNAGTGATEIKEGDSVYIILSVVNSGFGNAGVFTIAAEIDGGKTIYATVDGLLAGESRKITLSLGELEYGNHSVLIHIDPAGEVGNNAASGKTYSIKNIMVHAAAATVYELKDGASANGKIVLAGQRLAVLARGKSVNTVLGSYAEEYVYNGGVASGTQIGGNGLQRVLSGGSASGTVVYSGGFADAEGEIRDAVVLSGGALFAEGQGRAVGTAVGPDGWIIAEKGGRVVDTALFGVMFACEDGKAENTSVYEGAEMFVTEGGSASNTTILDGGTQIVSENGRAGTNIFYGDGTQNVWSDGYAGDNSFQKSGLQQVVGVGAVASNNIFSDSGIQYAADGAVVSKSIFLYKGEQIIDRATADETWLWGSSTQQIVNGGVARNTQIGAGCVAVAYAGGTLLRTFVAANAMLMVGSDGSVGSAFDITVSSGGVLLVGAGAVLGGDIVLGGRCSVAGRATGMFRDGVDTGPVIDFRIDQRTSADAVVIDNLSFLSGFNYTVSVSSGQSLGVYRLAGNASGFNQTISVCDASGAVYGLVGVGGALNVGTKSYSLVLKDNALSLYINASIAGAPMYDQLSISYGAMFLSAGEAARNTVLNDCSIQHISGGADVSGTIVNDGSILRIADGGRAADTVVNMGGCIFMDAGAVLSGTTLLNGGSINASGDINMRNEGSIHFSLSSFSTVPAEAVVSVSGWLLNDSCRITVGANQAFGNYRLVAGKTSGNSNITIGDDVSVFGTFRGILDVVYHNGVAYTLRNNGVGIDLYIGETAMIQMTMEGTLTDKTQDFSPGTVTAGKYCFASSAIPATFSGTVSILNDKGKKIYSCSIAKGKMKASDVLLAEGNYTIRLSAGKNGGDFSFDLLSRLLFTRANEAADDVWNSAPAIAYGESLSEWVGFGDALDYRMLALDCAGKYNFYLSGIENTAKLTVYEVVNGKLKSLKSLTVKSGGNVLSGILLDSSKTYCVAVAASGAAKGLNTAYELAFAGTQFDNVNNRLANNNWGDSGVGILDLAAGVSGEWVGFGDAVDFFQFALGSNQSGRYGITLDLEIPKFATMTLYTVMQNKKGKTVLTAVKSGKDGLYALGEGEYAVKVASSDNGKGTKNTAYGIHVDFSVPDGLKTQEGFLA